MIKRLLFLGMFLMAAFAVVSDAGQNSKDKYSPWYGPYGDGVYFRYVQSYLGSNTWADDYDIYYFENRASAKVEVTWDMSSGTHNSLRIGASDTGPRTALAPKERIRSITVKKI